MSDEEITNLNRPSLLPDFCRNRYVLPTLVVAELIAIVLCLTHYESGVMWLARLGVYSLCAQWIAIISISLLCLARKPLSALSDVSTALISYALILSVTAISSISFWYQANVPLRATLFGDDPWVFLGRVMLIIAITAGLVIHYLYVQHDWRRQIAMKAAARVQALQTKIRPHFLFNTMNTISTMLHSDPYKADDLIVKLCELLRAGLRDSDDGLLREELQLCHHYLDLEKMRLGDRLRVDWHTEALPDDAKIPWLTLQPLLENAIYHGIETRPDGGLVRITGSRNGNMLGIRMENPIGKIVPERAHHGHGHALHNTRMRLHHYYGSGNGNLSITDDSGLYTVQITFPYESGRINR